MVFFLGAGATKAIAPNAPLNKDLLTKALNDFKDLAEAKQLEDFISDLFKKRNNPPKDNRVWDLIDYIVQQDKSVSLKYNLEKIVNLRKCLLNLIIREFQKSLENIEPGLYESFISKIENTDSAIISTNYDILIDLALSKVDGLDYGAKVRRVVYGEYDEMRGFKRPLEYDAGFAINKARIPLLKIHGSLNWLYCSRCNEVDITTSKEGVLKTLAGSYYCSNTNCTNEYESLLITPTMFKNYENRFIKKIWELTEHALIEADNLIFIGYALKEEDYQIRCLLMKALLCKEKPYKKVIIVEGPPKKNVTKEEKEKEEKELKDKKDRYENLYGDKIIFEPVGFEEYIKKANLLYE